MKSEVKSDPLATPMSSIYSIHERLDVRAFMHRTHNGITDAKAREYFATVERTPGVKLLAPAYQKEIAIVPKQHSTCQKKTLIEYLQQKNIFDMTLRHLSGNKHACKACD